MKDRTCCQGRADQKAEEARARSTRAVEIALSFLTFVGMPLTVFLDVWTNWEAALGVGKRSSAFAGMAMPWGVIRLFVDSVGITA